MVPNKSPQGAYRCVSLALATATVFATAAVFATMAHSTAPTGPPTLRMESGVGMLPVMFVAGSHGAAR